MLEEQPAFLGVWLPAGLVVGVAMGGMGVAISSAAATAVAPERYASATGMNLTARQIGGALDVFLMCALAAVVAAAVPLRLGAAPAIGRSSEPAAATPEP